ncbi:nascent polypeptide-associated complex subunit alpha, muscle-specific form-like isoform X2 [Haliotis asinina]|uniref:nascent polypeptide-associated complex subunit alpha, muscle-specific form-like isoform X2 n=1 Tax=Haliotis asinina TaxID=109174 RepID=UPI0035325799
MSACSEFTQNAWRRDLCANCQRARADHTGRIHRSNSAKSSPVPSKRTSVILKATSQHINGVKVEPGDCITITSADIENANSKLNKNDRNSSCDKTKFKSNENHNSNLLQDENPHRVVRVVSSHSYSSNPRKGVLVKSVPRHQSRSGHVVFTEAEPDVIGYDGGLDNIFDDEVDSQCEGHSSSDEMSFTEEEKQNALLALENMIWNADIRNLKDSAISKKGPSKEFEDLDLQLLCRPDRFHTLRDCDASFKHGTFPVRTKPSLSKLSVEELFHSDIELHRIADTMCDKADSESSGSEQYKQTSVDKVKSLPASSASSSDSDSKASDDKKSVSVDVEEESDVTMPYKIVNIIPKHTPKPYVVPKESGKSYTLDDIEECLYGSQYESTSGPEPKQEVLTSEKEEEVSSTLKEEEKKKDGNTSFSDTESTIAGLEVVELLNDVLASYGEIESKYSDFRYSPRQPLIEAKPGSSTGESGAKETDSNTDARKDKLKKNADFEKRMASVAANLDLQKSRKSRQAPRPPSSPPPEPQVSPTRKLANQAEPNFKMVTVGKSIVTPPQLEPLIAPKAVSEPTLGLDEQDALDLRVGCKSADIGKAKRGGFTSFFKNILRRGRDSSELPVESSNPDITFAKPDSKTDVMSSSMIEIRELKEDQPPASPAEKRTAKFSPQPKFRVLPPATPPPMSPPVASSSSSPALNHKGSTEDRFEGAMPKAAPSSPLQHQKGVSSPKLRMKKDPEKSSPIMQRAAATKDDTPTVLPQLPANPPTTKPKTDFTSHTLPRDHGRSRDTTSTTTTTSTMSRSHQSSTSSPAPKPVPPQVPTTQPAAKPPPPPQHGTKPQVPPNPPQTKPQLPSKPPGSGGEDSGVVVRRRPKSPKKGAPPQPPTRTSVPARMTDARNPDFARELERRLSRSTEGAPSIRDRKSSTQGPPSPTSPVPELDESMPTSPTTLEKPDEVKKNEDDSPREKIELPTAAPMSRKSFLGKLGNKKVRAPQPPASVKRAKSITESTLPRTNKQKKINAADISGPVLVTDMTNTKILENRRNTISLGGPMSSSVHMDKEFEDLKPDALSPLGSLENLYEAILPKFRGRHVYDPITGNTVTTICPNIPVEGYLEPVPPVTATAGSASNLLTPSMTSSMCALPSTMTSSMMGMTSSMVAMPSTIEEEDSVGDPFDEEADIDESRQMLLASQPIYEEINGYNKVVDDDATSMVSTLSQVSQTTETDFLAPPDNTGRSQSRETVSSESDTTSTCSTLSRPKPAPRRKPKKGDRSSSEQYVAMNRPNTSVTLREDKLRDLHSRLTTMMLQSLQDIYSQVERLLSQEKLSLPAPHQLKWGDFDIYGQPLHASERCIVYNAKFKVNNSPCQLMLLHSRPATESSTVTHPSLLKPAAVFADTIPFSFLTEEFIKTSQLVQNSVYDSSLAKCFCAVGSFDIIESLDSHLSLLRETLTHNAEVYMNVILSMALQLLSAMSHCLDQGYTVTETDFRDIFLVTRSDLRGKVITFLPRQRSHDVHQGEAMCRFLDKLLDDAMTEHRAETESPDTLDTVETLQGMLQPRKVECLAQVRSVVEYLLWGPSGTDPSQNEPGRSEPSENPEDMEQDLSLWLEKERANLVTKFAKSVSGFVNGVSLEEYYCLKFLLKSSPTSLADSARRLALEC